MSIKRDCLEKAGFDVNGVYARNPKMYYQIIEAMEFYAKAVKNNAVLPHVIGSLLPSNEEMELYLKEQVEAPRIAKRFGWSSDLIKGFRMGVHWIDEYVRKQ